MTLKFNAALCCILMLSGCANGRFILAVHDKAQADLVGEALAVREAITLPDLPADCRKREYSGVKANMDLRETTLRGDIALTRANARVFRCAAWYDETKASIEGEGDE